jgi:hypothetical protein
MTHEEFDKIFGRCNTPILRGPDGTIYLAAANDWASSEEVTGTIDVDGEEVEVTESVPLDGWYVGLWTPVSWKCGDGPDAFVVSDDIPEDVLEEMKDYDGWEYFEIEELDFTGKFAK